MTTPITTEQEQAWELRERMRELIAEFNDPAMTAKKFIAKATKLTTDS